jgi:EAL domain-containing protein (putative c-di-GMP-specific phosphodiesterase class I)
MEALKRPFTQGGMSFTVTASVGIALHPSDGASMDALMRRSDAAMREVKQAGRAAFRFHRTRPDGDDGQSRSRMRLDHAMRQALAQDRFHLHYQPQVDLNSGAVVGAEALIRWRDPELGEISPGEFIPVAEESGFIVALGDWVLRRAVAQAAAWADAGLWMPVSVNVSALQFRRLDFVGMVERTLAETGFDPTRLELEITESTLLGNLDSAEGAMRRLKALGVKLALDDFGTGYSSLLYLRRFPFDRLKIDRSFVLSIEKAADAAAIVHAVVGLGRGLGMKVTAEGVETAEQHLFLRAAGVHCMQGYRFGRPMERTEISARLMVPGTYRTIEGDARETALAS